MVELTKHQRQALDQYDTLMEQQPRLFESRPVRPIVANRELLEAYAAENNVVLGVAAETPYVYFLVDLVSSRLEKADRRLHPYLRVVSRAQIRGGTNVVIVATIEDESLGPRGAIVVVDQERHALGKCVTELPRGFGEPGLSAEINAVRELRSETGYIGDVAHFLGETYIDSGLTDGQISFYHVPVTRRVDVTPEVEEAIVRVGLYSPEQMWTAIRSGFIRDSFSLQGLSLYEKRYRP